MLRRAIVTVACATVLAIASTASAQYGGPNQIDPSRSALWGEISFYSGETDVLGGIAEVSATSFSPLLQGYFGITDSLAIDFAWGLAFADVEVDAGILGSADESAFMIGNPFVGASYVHETGSWVLRLGGGVTLPVADADDGGGPEAAAERTALWLAAATRGLWDLWLWDEERMTIVIPRLRVDGKMPDLVWAVETALGVMLDTSDRDGRQTEVPFQVAVEGGARLGQRFVVGGRLQLVWIPTWDEDDGDPDDNAQLALEPFVRFETESAFAFAKLTMNLDEPLGFAFDDRGVWGLRLGGGARF